MSSIAQSLTTNPTNSAPDWFLQFPASQTAGNCNGSICGGNFNFSTRPNICSDDINGAYDFVKDEWISVTSNTIQGFIKQNIAGGGQPTVNWTGAFSNGVMGIFEIAGLPPTGSIIMDAQSYQGAANPISINLTLSAAGLVMIAGYNNDSNGTFPRTGSSPLTELGYFDQGGTQQFTNIFQGDVGSGSYTAELGAGGGSSDYVSIAFGLQGVSAGQLKAINIVQFAVVKIVNGIVVASIKSVDGILTN